MEDRPAVTIQTAHVLSGHESDRALSVAGYVALDGEPRVELGGLAAGIHLVLGVDDATDLGHRLMAAAAAARRQAQEHVQEGH